MSVSWPSLVALPGSREACGHPRCKRYTVASVAAIIGAVAAEFSLAIAVPDGGPLAVSVAAVFFTAGMVLACWPHPRDDDLEALIEATRDQIPDCVPDEWVKEFRQ